jgi:hypothetical protein
MNEYTHGWLATAKLLLIVAFATLYWIGGRKNKWVRRISGGLLISIGTVGFAVILKTFSPWHLLAIAAYPGALTLGYGGSTTPVKLHRRILFGAAVGACAFIFALPLGFKPILAAAFQMAVAIQASVVLGLLNPFEAAEEEAVIAALSVALVPFIV